NKDTLQIGGVQMTDFAVLDGMAYEDGNLFIDTEVPSNTQGGGAIYYSYDATTTPVIEDTAHAYNFLGSDVKYDADLNEGNNMLLINNSGYAPSEISSSDGYNVIKSFGSLRYSNLGGEDVVFSAGDKDDVYDISLSDTTSVRIYDFDGSDDVVNIAANYDNIRIVFNGTTTADEGRDHFVVINPEVLAGMTNAEFKYIFNSNVGANIVSIDEDGIEEITIGGESNYITFDESYDSSGSDEGYNSSWCVNDNSVWAAVAGWLEGKPYTSVADALDNCDADDLVGLKNCFLYGTETKPTP
ncbi:MAG: hypothetical protein K6E29_09015, partial [Cyanobacteria bacterium RUI128]|nr:hypothetical protein [Cyanobacteria bacterium RUI128]